MVSESIEYRSTFSIPTIIGREYPKTRCQVSLSLLAHEILGTLVPIAIYILTPPQPKILKIEQNVPSTCWYLTYGGNKSRNKIRKILLKISWALMG